MILGPPNFYDDGIRPARLRYPQAKPRLLKTPPPAAPNAEAIASLTELIVTHNVLTLHDIIRAVCIATNVRGNDFHSARRHRPVAEARQVYYYLAREMTRRSLPEIGRRCGGKDHSTVLHGIRKVAFNLEKYAATIAAAKKLLGVE